MADLPQPTDDLHEAATELLDSTRWWLARNDAHRAREALACSRRFRLEAERFTRPRRAA